MKTDMTKFTGLVVTCNEANRLGACLDSLAFCNEIIVVDLESEDESAAIAVKHGAKVIQHARVPIVEKVLTKALAHVKNQWVVLLDPDEIFPAGRIGEIEKILLECPDVGIIGVPRRNYFKGKPLFTTPWGMCNPLNRIINKDRVEVRPIVHHSIIVKEGYKAITLEYRGEESVIQHYWIDSITQMLEKHYRYLKLEGESRYMRGERFTWKGWRKRTKEAFKYSLIKCNGKQGGSIGIFLSIFYALYVCLGFLNLRTYQKKIEHIEKSVR